MELYELLRKADGADVDFLREGVRTLAQALMEVEVTAQVGAERGERAPERRVTQRNGYRPRDWDTRVGTVELAVPKLRSGSFFPSILEPRRRAERALASVVMACYVEGVSTRRVDEVARAMGIEQISKSQVSRICAELDELVDAWRNRPLDTGPYPLLWIDALSMRVREGGRICSTAVLVATAVNAQGHREILGLDIGTAEDGASWTSFLRGLVARGLHGVKLVTSDAHQGLKAAIGAVLDGASWQRCRTHWACMEIMCRYSSCSSDRTLLRWHGGRGGCSRATVGAGWAAAAAPQRAAAAPAAGNRGPAAGPWGRARRRPGGQGQRDHHPQGPAGAGRGPGATAARPRQAAGWWAQTGRGQRPRTGACPAGAGGAGRAGRPDVAAAVDD
jgi:putative transposase